MKILEESIHFKTFNMKQILHHITTHCFPVQSVTFILKHIQVKWMNHICGHFCLPNYCYSEINVEAEMCSICLSVSKQCERWYTNTQTQIHKYKADETRQWKMIKMILRGLWWSEPGLGSALSPQMPNTASVCAQCAISTLHCVLFLLYNV